jgi:hypothetical protein
MLIKYKKSCSDGCYLRFHTEDEKTKYEIELHNLNMRYYHKEILKRGIYADNQNIYINRESEFNEKDSRIMYNWYQKWLKEE